MILRRAFLRMAFAALASGMLGTELMGRAGGLVQDGTSAISFDMHMSVTRWAVHDSHGNILDSGEVENLVTTEGVNVDLVAFHEPLTMADGDEMRVTYHWGDGA